MQSVTSGRTQTLKQLLPWLGVMLATAAFAADLLTPLGIAVGAGYALSVLSTFAHPHRNATLGMAALVTLMIGVGFLASGDRGNPYWIGIVGRGVVLATVWGAAVLLMAFGQLTGRIRKIEIESHARHAWLAQTLASIGDGVIACDASGRIEFMNEVAERLTGWRERDAIKRMVGEVFDIHEEGSGRKLPIPAETALQTGRIAGLSGRAVLRSRDGGHWPIDDSASPIRDDRHEIAGAVMVFRDISDRRKDEQQMELRLREAGHRIKNVFANVHAILILCSRTSNSPVELVNCVESRMASLVRSSDRLIRASDKGSSLREIVVDEVEPYLAQDPHRLHFAGGDILLPPQAAVSVGMIMHELATNASKHGSLSTAVGRIEVRCDTTVDGELRITWTESGGPSALPPQETGMGAHLIEGLIRTQFAGRWEPTYGEQGFSCCLHLKLYEAIHEPAAQPAQPALA